MGIEVRKIIVITCDEPGCDAAFSRETEISGVTAIMAAASVEGWVKKHRSPYRVLCPIHAGDVTPPAPPADSGPQELVEHQDDHRAGDIDGGADAGQRYLDEQGRELFVCDGISGGRTWSVYYRKPNGSLKHHTGFKHLSDPIEAQAELDAAATKRRWALSAGNAEPESSAPLADTPVDALSRGGSGEFNSPETPRDEASNA